MITAVIKYDSSACSNNCEHEYKCARTGQAFVIHKIKLVQLDMKAFAQTWLCIVCTCFFFVHQMA